MLARELEEELKYLEITASRRFRSMQYGQSRSPIKGVGYEFETHRKYEIGDDLRRVDWNVSARMQQLYLKRHFEEKDVTVFLAVDVSRSMNFSTTDYQKRIRVLQVAATLGFSALCDSYNFGFMAFSDTIEAFELPRRGRGHVWRGIDRLYHLKPKGTGSNWEVALRFLRSRLRRMSIIFLLSDFVTNPEVAGLADMPDLKILAQKHDVIPIIFSDQLETKLPVGRGLLRFRSAESNEEMLMSLSGSHRRKFEALIQERQEALRNLFFSLGMECLFLQVRDPFMDPIMMLFERRRKI